MRSVAEQHYIAEIHEGTATLWREIRYRPTDFLGMVERDGEVGASRRLIRSSKVPTGFVTLQRHDRLHMTVEALALLPWYSELFDHDDRRRARYRLEQFGFDVDGFLRRRTASPPRWVARQESQHRSAEVDLSGE